LSGPRVSPWLKLPPPRYTSGRRNCTPQGFSRFTPAFGKKESRFVGFSDKITYLFALSLDSPFSPPDISLGEGMA